MKYTERQKAEFKARFIQTRRYQIAAFVPVIGAVFLLSRGKQYIAEFGLQPMLLGTVGLLVVAAGFSWLNWRCPACRKLLDMDLRPEHCQKCGVELT